MNNIFIEVPGSEETLEVTPHGVSVVHSICWPAYSSFVIWTNSEFFLVERQGAGSVDGLEYAGKFWNLAEIALRGVKKFYYSVYGNTAIYTVKPLGHSERLIVITSTDDYGCIVYPSGAKYDGFAGRLVDDFATFSLYHSGYLFDAEFVFDSGVAAATKAMLWEACRLAVVEESGWWETNSIFDGERQLYRVRSML